MMKQILFSFTILPLFLFHCTTILAQSPAQAPASAFPVPVTPAPAVPVPATPAPAAFTPAALAPAPQIDITKILRKAGKFKVFIRLLKSTQVADRINGQLSTINGGFTLFAPTDSAFSGLKVGTLNSLTTEQQVQLVLFHIIPNFLPTSQFPTVSNPLRTQAGDTTKYGYPLNITTSGNLVNISTGIVNATVADTVYSDNQLAIYQVDKVLLPLNIFGPKPPASAPAPAPVPAPAPPKPKPTKSTAVSPIAVDTSGAVCFAMHGIMVSIGVAVVAAIFSS